MTEENSSSLGNGMQLIAIDKSTISIAIEEHNTDLHKNIYRAINKIFPRSNRESLDKLDEPGQINYLRKLYSEQIIEMWLLMWLVFAIAGVEYTDLTRDEDMESDELALLEHWTYRAAGKLLQIGALTFLRVFSSAEGNFTFSRLLLVVGHGSILALMSTKLNAVIFVRSSLFVLLICCGMLFFSVQRIRRLTPNETIFLQWASLIVGYGFLCIHFTWWDSFRIVITSLCMVNSLTFRSNRLVKLLMTMAKAVNSS